MSRISSYGNTAADFAETSISFIGYLSVSLLRRTLRELRLSFS